MSLADLRPGLRALLLADATVAAAVAGRIYAGQLPQGERRASVVFNLISGIGDYNMQGPSGLARPRYQIDAWSPDADVAASLGRAIKGAIDGYAGAVSFGSNSPQDQVTIQGVFADNERDAYSTDEKLFGVSQDFFIWFVER